jgi:hypothetical protein
MSTYDRTLTESGMRAHLRIRDINLRHIHTALTNTSLPIRDRRSLALSHTGKYGAVEVVLHRLTLPLLSCRNG